MIQHRIVGLSATYLRPWPRAIGNRGFDLYFLRKIPDEHENANPVTFKLQQLRKYRSRLVTIDLNIRFYLKLPIHYFAIASNSIRR